MSHNQIVELESELSRLKTEIKNLDEDWSRTKNQLLDEIRRSESMETILNLANQTNLKTLEYTRTKEATELILIETYFKAVQQ